MNDQIITPSDEQLVQGMACLCHDKQAFVMALVQDLSLGGPISKVRKVLDHKMRAGGVQASHAVRISQLILGFPPTCK